MEESYTNTVLQAISKALHEGINDVTKVIAVIAAVIVMMIILVITFRLRNRKHILRAAEASYQSLIRKFDLTILDLDLIDKLAETLKKPEEKYTLLVDAGKLRRAEHKTAFIDNKEKERLQSLKIKLGFLSTEIEPGETSTRIFTREMPAKISADNNNFYDAEIYSVSDSNITVKSQGDIKPGVGETVSLYTVTSGKIRAFRLLPDRVRNELFTAPHTEALTLVKQKVKIGILFESAAPENKSSGDSGIILLSGEGAYITDKNNEMQSGDLLKLFLDNDHRKLHPVEAEVIQVSKEKKLASIRFGNNEPHT